MLDLCRKLLCLLDQKGRRMLVFLFVLLFVMTGLEMASIGMIIPFVGAIIGGEDNFVLNQARSLFPDYDAREMVIFIGVVFAGFFVVKNILLLGVTYAINYFVRTSQARLCQRMFSIYLHQPYVFHLGRNTSQILRNLTASVGMAFEGLRQVANLFLETLMVGAVCLLLLMLEPMVTLAIGAPMVILSLIFYAFVGPVTQRWGEEIHSLEAEHIRSINQSFGALKEIKVLGCESHQTGLYAEHIDALAHNNIRSSTALQAPRFFAETVVVISFLVIILILLATRGSIEAVATTVGLFGMAALRLMPSMNRILYAATEIKSKTAPIEGIHEDLQKGALDREKQEAESDAQPLAFEKNIQIENLTFHYPDTPSAALEDVSLSIAKGESVGLVGPSGAGKTSLVDVLLTLLKPSRGRLLIDGADAFADPRKWRTKIGYVPQQIYLLDDTLRRNIALGLKDHEIDDEKVLAAVRSAHFDSVLAKLPHGLDTVVGENGVRLSGGQRQRIGIARALYRDPEVLVFDEATSALDNETEIEVAKAIEELSGEKTIIIIAHRLSTVRKCDRLVFMKDGKICDIGPFDELKKRNPDFARMAQLGDMGDKGGAP